MSEQEIRNVPATALMLVKVEIARLEAENAVIQDQRDDWQDKAEKLVEEQQALRRQLAEAQADGKLLERELADLRLRNSQLVKDGEHWLTIGRENDDLRRQVEDARYAADAVEGWDIVAAEEAISSLTRRVEQAEAALAAMACQCDFRDHRSNPKAHGEHHSPECKWYVGPYWTNLMAELAAARESAKALAEAIRKARHNLVALNGLVASDGYDAYSAALDDGCDPSGAWDVFTRQTWHINEEEAIAQLDAALAAVEEEMR